MPPKYELRSRLFAPHLPVPQALDRVSMKTGRGRAEAKTAIRSTVTDNVGEIKNLIYLDEAIYCSCPKLVLRSRVLKAAITKHGSVLDRHLVRP